MPVEVLEDKGSEQVIKKEEPKTEVFSLSKFYQVPREFVKIPSKGVIYSQEANLGGEIEMRYMTAADEDDLTSPSLIRKGIWLSKLLQNCMVNKAFDANDLLVGDRNALLFWLRQSAYGSQYNLAINCNNLNCQKKFENEFKLDQLIMKTMDISPVVEGVNEFKFTLPKSGLEVRFALMTGKMSEELSKEFDTQNNATAPKDKIITSRLKKQVTSIQGITDKAEIAQFIDKGMLASDSMALRNFIDENTPDIILKQEATCTHCGSTSNFDIPIEIQFFWPQPKS